MLNMSTFFKVQMGQNRVITGVSAVDPTVRVVKRLISVKTIGFYIVSLVGKVIFKEDDGLSHCYGNDGGDGEYCDGSSKHYG